MTEVKNMPSEKKKTKVISKRRKGSKEDDLVEARSSPNDNVPEVREANTPEIPALRSEAKTQYALELEEMLAEYEALREEMAGADWEKLFDEWERRRYNPKDFKTPVPADSLEASIGYESLFRQLHAEFDYKMAYYTSVEGGALTTKEARSKAFHECTNREEALKHFEMLIRSHVGSLSFTDLLGLQQFAPRVAERLWERIKREGQKEFQSGYLSANITFPPDYQNRLWNIARYQGVRDSYIEDWKPQGGIELSLLDMLTQAYFQWQYWLEQTVVRSKTTPNEDHPHYDEWKTIQLRTRDTHGLSGYWLKPTLDEAASLEQAFRFADRWHRAFMRTLRQLRDLRRYAPVLINNVEQVNIAADGGQQVNVSGNGDSKTKKVRS